MEARGAILTVKGLDLIVGRGKLALLAATIRLPLCLHLLAIIVGLRSVWRIAVMVTVSAAIATCLWMRQVSSEEYRITIGPEIVFYASDAQFSFGTAIVELGAFIASRLWRADK